MAKPNYSFEKRKKELAKKKKKEEKRLSKKAQSAGEVPAPLAEGDQVTAAEEVPSPLAEVADPAIDSKV
ncbi:MAG: hypothetical protein ACI87W_002843 [Halieaceae bacterium]|jgi:hypothetical protein